MKRRIGFVPEGHEPEQVVVSAGYLGEVGAGSALEQPEDEW